MKVAIIGASGYAGAELVKLLSTHPHVEALTLLVSAQSTSVDVAFSTLYPSMLGLCDTRIEAFSTQWLSANHSQLDAVFLATPHEFSQQWAHAFLELNICVFDLSGAFRLSDTHSYPKYYGFTHSHSDLLVQAVYGLAEFADKHIAMADLIACPGCYPTASLLAIKPLSDANLIDINQLVVINGISGVSGAGRVASLATSFNELSLRPYNVLSHRHQPEINEYAGVDVVFNPHIAPFKRGLMATVTLKVQADVNEQMINQAFSQCYQHAPLVRFSPFWPQIDDVAYTPFANLHWQFDADKQIVVVCCALDNLLKGAAAQAVQCFNIRFGFSQTTALLGAQYD